MLHDLTSNNDDFKAFEFSEGLNLILAEKIGHATSTNTSNNCGKTSLTDGIYSLLGGDPKSGSLGKPEFREIPLTGHLDIGDQLVEVTRVPMQNKIKVQAHDLNRLLHSPRDENQGEATIETSEWKKVLGHHWFNVPHDGFDLGPSSPIGGRLIRYIARRHEGEGMKHPTKTFGTEKAVDASTSIAYLLGAPWRESSAYGETLAQSNAVKKLKEAKKEGSSLFKRVLGFTENLDDQIRSLREEVETMEEAASRQDDAAGDEALRVELDQAQQKVREIATKLSDAKRAWNAITRSVEGSHRDFDAETWLQRLPEQLQPILAQRVEDVQKFHDAVVSNRREYLEGHRRKLQEEIPALEELHATAVGSLRRSLRRHNSDSWVASIRGRANELAEKKGRLQHLEETAAARKRLEAKQSELKQIRQDNKNRMLDSLDSMKDHIDELSAEYDEIVRSVYHQENVRGELIFRPETQKLDVVTTIGGTDRPGHGVKQVGVWAMDLLLKHYEKEREFSSGILVHDSHMFDHVDEDQRPLLLEVARKRCLREGWQYIVTMNEHAFGDTGLSEELAHCVNSVRLNDSVTGGLFGFKDASHDPDA